MGRRLLAVAVNEDERVVAKGMFGTARRFVIYEVDQGRARRVEVRENPYATTRQHGKTLDVWALLDDCQELVASHVGVRGQQRLRAMGVELHLTGGPTGVLAALQTSLPGVRVDD